MSDIGLERDKRKMRNREVNYGLGVDTAAPLDEFEEAQCMIYSDDGYDDEFDWGTDPDDYYYYDDES